MDCGKDQKAINIVYKVARDNGKTTIFTVADLEVSNKRGQHQITSATALLNRHLSKRNVGHVRVPFVMPKSAWLASLILLNLALMSLKFLLYNNFLPRIQAGRCTDFGDAPMDILYCTLTTITDLSVSSAPIGGVLLKCCIFAVETLLPSPQVFQVSFSSLKWVLIKKRTANL